VSYFWLPNGYCKQMKGVLRIEHELADDGRGGSRWGSVFTD
jgi:hypothetical protein